MSYAEMPWSLLTKELYESRLTEGCRVSNTHESSGYLWTEATRRIRLIARKGFRRAIPIADLEDVEQAVILKLLSVDVLRAAAGSNSPGVYIARMVRNAAVDHMRRRIHDITATAEPLSDNLPAPEERDDRGVGGRTDKLERSLTDLSLSDRELLRRRFWEDQSIQEIAATMELPYSTVAKRLFRAVARLRPEIELSNA